MIFPPKIQSLAVARLYIFMQPARTLFGAFRVKSPIPTAATQVHLLIAVVGPFIKLRLLKSNTRLAA
jgi:hypothetical protein